MHFFKILIIIFSLVNTGLALAADGPKFAG